VEVPIPAIQPEVAKAEVPAPAVQPAAAAPVVQPAPAPAAVVVDAQVQTQAKSSVRKAPPPIKREVKQGGHIGHGLRPSKRRWYTRHSPNYKIYDETTYLATYPGFDEEGKRKLFTVLMDGAELKQELRDTDFLYRTPTREDGDWHNDSYYEWERDDDYGKHLLKMYETRYKELEEGADLYTEDAIQEETEADKAADDAAVDAMLADGGGMRLQARDKAKIKKQVGAKPSAQTVAAALSPVVDAITQKKTKCFNWSSTGKCRRGQKCIHAHDPVSAQASWRPTSCRHSAACAQRGKPDCAKCEKGACNHVATCAQHAGPAEAKQLVLRPSYSEVARGVTPQARTSLMTAQKLPERVFQVFDSPPEERSKPCSAGCMSPDCETCSRQSRLGMASMFAGKITFGAHYVADLLANKKVTEDGKATLWFDGVVGNFKSTFDVHSISDATADLAALRCTLPKVSSFKATTVARVQELISSNKRGCVLWIPYNHQWKSDLTPIPLTLKSVTAQDLKITFSYQDNNTLTKYGDCGCVVTTADASEVLGFWAGIIPGANPVGVATLADAARIEALNG